MFNRFMKVTVVTLSVVAGPISAICQTQIGDLSPADAIVGEPSQASALLPAQIRGPDSTQLPELDPSARPEVYTPEPANLPQDTTHSGTNSIGSTECMRTVFNELQKVQRARSQCLTDIVGPIRMPASLNAHETPAPALTDEQKLQIETCKANLPSESDVSLGIQNCMH
jgi:hypothetical protein